MSMLEIKLLYKKTSKLQVHHVTDQSFVSNFTMNKSLLQATL